MSLPSWAKETQELPGGGVDLTTLSLAPSPPHPPQNDSTNTPAPYHALDPSPSPINPSHTSPKPKDPANPQPREPSIFTLNVGGRIFRTYATTLRDAGLFDRMFERWPHANSAKNPLFIDADPDLFAHILRYLRRPQIFPLFWDPAKGFDYDLYNRLEAEAQYFDIQPLENWIKERRYLKAVEVTFDTLLADLNKWTLREGPTVEHDRFAVTRCREVYVCPRGIPVHRGDRNRCGQACVRARGSEPVRYEKEEHVDVVTVRKTTTFDQSVCRL